MRPRTVILLISIAGTVASGAAVAIRSAGNPHESLTAILAMLATGLCIFSVMVSGVPR
jgi:hypothetical protein